MCLVQWNLGSIKYMATKHCFASNSVHKTWRNSNNNTASVPITDNIGSTQFLLNISNIILANLKSNIFWVYVYLTMRLYIGVILYIDTDTMRLVLFCDFIFGRVYGTRHCWLKELYRVGTTALIPSYPIQGLEANRCMLSREGTETSQVPWSGQAFPSDV